MEGGRPLPPRELRKFSTAARRTATRDTLCVGHFGWDAHVGRTRDHPATRSHIMNLLRGAIGTDRPPSHRVALAVCLALLATLGYGTACATANTPVRSLLEFRQDRVVVQQWDLSCGVAALATLLRYQHGDPVSEKEIALALMQRAEYLEDPELIRARAGFSLLDFARYLEARGYRGIGMGQLTLEDLVAHAPIMVPVNLHGYEHFVVFRGVGGDRVLLADPAWGNRTMRVERFEAAWLAFPELGKVGFTVARLGGAPASNALAPREIDFVLLR
jgi:uncharacterized protein